VFGALAAMVLAVAAAQPTPAAAPVRPSSGRVIARGIPFPTNLAFDPVGGLWVTAGAGGPQPGDGVWYVRRAGARPRHVARGLTTPLGLTWFGSELYVAHIVSPRTGRVTAFTGFDGRRFRRRRVVVRALPIGRHTVDSIVPGPGGRLYLGVGSEFDNRRSRRPLAGTVVSFRPGGRGLRVEARGLRNPYGLAFVPGTRDLLVTDNGRDDLGPRRPPDELNVFDVAGPAPDFGFPRCFGRGGAGCAGKRPALATFPPHASSDGLAVTRHWGRGGLTAFVAENGSSFPRAPTGRDVRQVALTRRRDGSYRARVSVFARGFRQNDPLGAAIGPDGRLYVTLFVSGQVRRFAPAP
jgi:glucose/arabinose dehydrogenase